MQKNQVLIFLSDIYGVHLIKSGFHLLSCIYNDDYQKQMGSKDLISYHIDLSLIWWTRTCLMINWFEYFHMFLYGTTVGKTNYKINFNCYKFNFICNWVLGISMNEFKWVQIKIKNHYRRYLYQHMHQWLRIDPAAPFLLLVCVLTIAMVIAISLKTIIPTPFIEYLTWCYVCFIISHSWSYILSFSPYFRL